MDVNHPVSWRIATVDRQNRYVAPISQLLQDRPAEHTRGTCQDNAMDMGTGRHKPEFDYLARTNWPMASMT
jgi:hypothetical protein